MKNAGLAIFIFTLMFLSVVPVSLAGNSDEADAVLPGPDASGSRAGGVNNESVTFKSGDCDVPANLYYPSSGSNLPAVVFGVGYAAHITSLFESSNYGWLGEGLASRGYVVLVVRYCANYSDYMDLINIAYDYSLWVNETRDAVTALIEGNLVGASVPTSDIVDAKRVALGGHSIGGAVSIVSGALDRRVKCVFVMSPQNFAGTPRMNDHIDDISPVPIQLQVGEEDMLVGVTTVQQSYDAASIPKEIVKYRYGTYEGFTDLGKIENIEVGDLPSAIREVIRPYIQENPLSTKQHAMSINFTRGFLDYYLENEQSFNIKEDYSEDFVIPGVPPVVPPTPVTDVWHATVAHEGLDDIFHGLSALPEILDYSEGDEINLRARITPRGIYETGVKAVLTFPEGTVENYDMAFNDDYDTSAGDFRRTLNIPITHDLGTVQVIINATNDKGHTYTSDPIYFTLTTTSDKPVINSVDITPSPMVPGEVITFTVSASDKDGIAYYSFDFGNGTKTGWIESNTAAHTYKESGHYTIRIRVKDSKAQESNDEVIPATVSHRPVAKLKVDSSVHKGKAVDFDASGSSDEDGDALEYFFIFGDGNETGWIQDSKVTHKYSAKGDFEVSVKVRDIYDLESEPVSKTIKVKEKKSGLESLTSSSSFPILVILVIGAIAGGGFFLLRGGKEEKPGPKPTPEASAGKGMEKKEAGAVPSGAKPSTAKPQAGVPTPEGKSKEGEIPVAKPAPGQPTPGESKLPKPAMKPEAKPLPKSEVKPPEEPESKPKEEPSEPEKVVPEPPKPSEPPKPKEPEVDAPPVKEESWDEAVKEEGDLWEDEDFAIPVALKEKLKKESEE